jgi:hypothetical protein
MADGRWPEEAMADGRWPKEAMVVGPMAEGSEDRRKVGELKNYSIYHTIHSGLT